MIIEIMHKIIYHLFMMHTQNDGREPNEQNKGGRFEGSRREEKRIHAQPENG